MKITKTHQPDWLPSLQQKINKLADSHGESSAYKALASDAAADFWNSYAAMLNANGQEDPEATCIVFARRCQSAWLSYHSHHKAKNDQRDWSRIAASFSNALSALDEMGALNESTIDIYSRRNNEGYGLRAQLKRARDTANSLADHSDQAGRGRRTPPTRFIDSLQQHCAAIPLTPMPKYPQIRALIYALYDIDMSNAEVGNILTPKKGKKY